MAKGETRSSRWRLETAWVSLLGLCSPADLSLDPGSWTHSLHPFLSLSVLINKMGKTPSKICSLFTGSDNRPESLDPLAPDYAPVVSVLFSLSPRFLVRDFK